MAVINLSAARDAKVAREVAESEFERMCAARRIETDLSELAGDDAESFTAIRKRVVRAIERGELVVTDAGDPIYTPPVPGAKSLTFYKPTGATFMAMDNGKGNMARMVDALTEMTRSARGEISKLDAPDFQFCQSLATLFLAPR